MFDSLVPRGTLPYVSARLTDGTRLSGYVTRWHASAEEEKGHVVLWGPNLSVKPKGGDPIPLDEWESVVVRLDQVAYVQVAYRPIASERTTAAGPAAVGASDDGGGSGRLPC